MERVHGGLHGILMAVAAFYFAYFAATGVLIPYLPPYLRGLGLSGSQIGVIGALTPAMSLLAPPLWGFAADRLQRPALVLRAVTAGAALAFAPLLVASSFGALALAVAGYAFFSTGIIPLADAIAVVEARRLSTDYARLRLWGSIGFIATSSLFGLWLAGRGSPASVVPVALALIAAHAAVAHSVPATRAVGHPPGLADAARLATDGRLLLFMGGAMLHWAAAAPFHQFFAIHLRDLGVPESFVGAGIAVGVSAEVVVMWRFRSIAARLPIFGVIGLAYGAGAVRWWLMGFVQDGAALAAIQALHGISFGAFLVGSIAHLERTVPEELRATGRALFSAVVFGLGGIAGMLLAGVLYDAGGGAAAFRSAAVLEVLAPLGLLGARRRREV